MGTARRGSDRFEEASPSTTRRSLLRDLSIPFRRRGHRDLLDNRALLIGGRDNDMRGRFVPIREVPGVDSLVPRRPPGLRTVGAPSWSYPSRISPPSNGPLNREQSHRATAGPATDCLRQAVELTDGEAPHHLGRSTLTTALCRDRSRPRCSRDGMPSRSERCSGRSSRRWRARCEPLAAPSRSTPVTRPREVGEQDRDELPFLERSHGLHPHPVDD